MRKKRRKKQRNEGRVRGEGLGRGERDEGRKQRGKKEERRSTVTDPVVQWRADQPLTMILSCGDFFLFSLLLFGLLFRPFVQFDWGPGVKNGGGGECSEVR